jgi:hypothetical protein
MAIPDPRHPPHRAARAAAALDGPALARAFVAGAAALAEQADAINAINVFPVPDGDTGTNMSMTMRAAAGAARNVAGGTAASVARAAADAALMGAKGNSGVILSQILAGFAAMADATPLEAAALAAALDRGRESAYRLVSMPKEGTILTAIAEAARGARAAAAGGATAEDALAVARDAAQEAVANSPNLLPVLKEAGVVDSGAQGLYVLLAGMVAGLRGERASLSIDGGQIHDAWLAATQRLHRGEGVGYCTEFVVSGAGLDRDALRQAMMTMGESVLVVGGDETLRVHVHAADPQAVFARARALGAVSHEKADDMQAQIDVLANGRHASVAAAVAGIAVVAVAAGDGIEELLRSIGAAAVVHGGQTMNPSAGEIAAAIDATGAGEVIVLPDNANIVLAARQAAAAVAKQGVRAEVLPAVAVPQGIAALVAMNSEATFEENITLMQAALGRVSSAEVTRAVRSTTMDGRDVREGQAIAVIDGRLAVVEDSLDAAVLAAVATMTEGRASPLVTLYYGEGADEAAAEALAASLRSTHDCDVEVVPGGQPHYPYLIGVE